MRQPVANLQTTLAIRPECAFAGQEFVAAGAHRREHRAKTGGQSLTVEPLQLGLGIEGIEMAGPALHEQEYHRLGARRMMRKRQAAGRFGGARCPGGALAKHAGERQGAEAAPRPQQEIAPRGKCWNVRTIRDARVRNHDRSVHIKEFVQVQERVANVFECRLWIGRDTRSLHEF